MYRSHPYVWRRSYITPLRRSILRVGDLGGFGALLDSLYRSNLANETETDHFIWEGKIAGVTRTWSKSTERLRIRFMRSRTADSTTARVGSVGLKTHHLVAPTTGVLDGSDSLNCPWIVAQNHMNQAK